MSFFDDDDDEPRTVRARRPRPAAAPRRSSSGGGSAAADPQAIRRRQLVAAGIVILFFIIVILGVKSCSTSARKRHLREYNDSVSALAQKSENSVAKPLFRQLSGASSSAGGKSVEIQSQISGLKLEADQQLKQAQNLDVPSQANEAQRYVLQALEFRRDGMAVIAQQIQPALSGNDNGAAARRIAGEMRAFDTSDVIWSQRVVPTLRNALRDNDVTGAQVASSVFLPSVSWLDSTYVADKLGQAGSGGGGTSGPVKPGTHGHGLTSTSVGNTTLSTSTTNQVPATPTPTFSVAFQNQGENDETNVKVQVKVGSITATKTVPKSTAGQSTTAQVPLGKTPPTGSVQTVKVTVLPVPGEKDSTNNTQSYPILFTR